jgi:hypothetical protein
MVRGTLVLVSAVVAFGCGDDISNNDCGPAPFAIGTDGHADPLGSTAGEARAGRIRAAQLPTVASGLPVWADGDFVLANDKVALVIEDVGPSDLYDPWGGRPVGVARVESGALVDPADFGEFFVLTGRSSVVTTSVSVIADGSDGGAAIVRASGWLSPTPFFEAITAGLFREEYPDIETAIDYVLEPGSETVDIVLNYNSPRGVVASVVTTMHGYMYTKRMLTWAPELGFSAEGERIPYMGFIDDDATSYAYSTDEELGPGIAASGFVANFTGEFDIEPCATTSRVHARLTIGGPGLDGMLQTVARRDGVTLKTITGTVTDAGGNGAAGVRVHVESATGGYVTRAMTDENGDYSVHVPEGQPVALTAWRRGDSVVGPVSVAASASVSDIQLMPVGTIDVVTTDADLGGALPVRIQVLPATGTSLPTVPGHFGEPQITGGRLHVEYSMDGTASLRAPVGDWEVVVSRGYEYELHRETVSVVADTTSNVAAALSRVVDTTGLQCADYHIHTHRSNDSGDDATEKVMSGIADGLEIPVRSEHEYLEDFKGIIDDLGMQAWAVGVPSV